MAVTELTAIWQGFSGAPGYTRMRFEDALDATAATAAYERMRNFFQALVTLLPDEVTIGFNEPARIYNDAGIATGEVSAGSPGVVTGVEPGSFSAPSGAVVNWSTGVFLNGRSVRGRTFLVPLAAAAYGTDGTLTTTAQSTIQVAAQALADGTPRLVIISQPPGAARNEVLVSTASVPDRAAVLRSRRD